MHPAKTAALLVAAAAAVSASHACAPGLNYSSLDGPRYAGGVEAPRLVVANAAVHPGRALRLVTFNVRYGVEVDSAIAVLRFTPALDAADVVALQEVDAAGTARIAASLGMRYVYYPATLHPKFGRDFGNAVLSRWPIVADRKLILPHLGRFRHTARIATAVTIAVDGAPIRIYSAHLGTMAEISPQSKREQAQAIMADAAEFAHVAILGDMNSHGIGESFRAEGFAWPTELNPRTFSMGRWDHVFLKGITMAGNGATGVVPDNRGASDHLPVWAVIASPTP